MSTRKTLKEFLAFRLRNHKNHDVFWMFLTVIVCGVGAAGIWATVIPTVIQWNIEVFNLAKTTSAIYTFFPALLVTSCAELILPDKVSKPVKMLSIILVIIALPLMILCANVHVIASLFFGLIGCCLAVCMWIIAHGEDPAFNDDDITIQASQGGENVQRPVSGNEGGNAL